MQLLKTCTIFDESALITGYGVITTTCGEACIDVCQEFDTSIHDFQSISLKYLLKCSEKVHF